MGEQGKTYVNALADFEAAHRKAAFEEIIARISKKPVELLPYDEIQKRLRSPQTSVPKLKEVPINAIVGSVSRYTDFSRSFLPRKMSDRDRWASVMDAQLESSGLPPVDLYQIGEVYFILDGHHRISVAKNLGAESIQAYVRTVESKIPLLPGDSPDELILKTERSVFEVQTQISRLLPDNKIEVTSPGAYGRLFEHIQVHRYFMGIDFSRDISLEEAVVHWYETVFTPILQVINKHQLLLEFPGRTEADLYLWLAEHRESLKDEMGWEIPVDSAARDLSDEFGQGRNKILRFINRSIHAILPDTLEYGPPTGIWRQERQEEDTGKIVRRILVAINGRKPGFDALDAAIAFAQQENAWIGGLYVTNDREKEKNKINKLKTIFDQRCIDAGVAGQFSVENGNVAKVICSRAYFADLAVLRMNYPPPFRFIERISSGLRMVIQQCPSPILAVPGTQYHFESAVLAFDNSPKAQEALYFAAYLASRWKTRLIVITVMESISNAEKRIENAKDYLDKFELDAEYICKPGEPQAEILKAARTHKAGLIIMGGYHFGPIRSILGVSTVDRILHKSKIPVLICK